MSNANSAGIAVSGPMHGPNVDRLEAMMSINIVIAIRLAHAAKRFHGAEEAA